MRRLESWKFWLDELLCLSQAGYGAVQMLEVLLRRVSRASLELWDASGAIPSSSFNEETSSSPETAAAAAAVERAPKSL